MKRTTVGASALALSLAITAAPSATQTQSPSTGGGVQIAVFGGGAFPTGDMGRGLNLGFRLGGGVALRPVTMPLGLNVNLAYDRFAGDDEIVIGTYRAEDVGLWSGSADVVWQFPTDPAANFRPFVDAGVGLFRRGEYAGTESQTKFGFQIGGGFDVPFGGLATFIEAKYVSVATAGDRSNFIPIVIGLRFGGGNTTTSGHSVR